MITAFDNIGLAAADRERSVAFYERLGFDKAFENELGCMMVAGSSRVFVFSAIGAAPASPQRSFDLRHSPPGIDHISFLVDDVDRTHAELIAKGVQFESPPADQSWGARTAALRDPDGNHLYLLEWRR
jgi:catechol 2,3-dioxygenase-like lactoylglutathione lyase family enzyme